MDPSARTMAMRSIADQGDPCGKVVQTAMDGFWIADARGRFLAVNDSYCELIGYPRDELVAMSIAEIETTASAKETAGHLQAAVRNGTDQYLASCLHRLHAERIGAPAGGAFISQHRCEVPRPRRAVHGRDLSG
jgi:PAS domain-containing protein